MMIFIKLINTIACSSDVAHMLIHTRVRTRFMCILRE